MCGIVGLFLKDRALEPQLGDMLSTMLITMSVMLFAVSFWTLSKMKAFLFSPT